MYTPPSSSVWNTFFSVGTSLKPSLPPRSTHMKLPLASARSVPVRMQWVPTVGDVQHAASEPTHAFEAATVTPRSVNHCRVYDCASASRARLVWMKLRRKGLSLSSAEKMTSAGEDTAVSNIPVTSTKYQMRLTLHQHRRLGHRSEEQRVVLRYERSDPEAIRAEAVVSPCSAATECIS